MQQTRHKATRFLQWVAMVCLITSLIATGYTARVVRAEGPNQATLLVVFGPDDIYTSCISFNETEISGSELLVRSGLTIVTQAVAGMGVSVCKIDDTGCDFPGKSCFCQCLGTPCNYWSYWTWRDGSWLYAGRGASQNVVRPGDINAWVWGDGQTSPPVVNAKGACGVSGSILVATNTPVPPQIAQNDPYPAGTEPAAAVPTNIDTPPDTETATPEANMTPTDTLVETATETTAGTVTGTVVATQTQASTPTNQASRATPAPSLTSSALPKATHTPDRSASVIAQVATNRSQTGVPTVSLEAAEKRSYWAFAGIALLLLLAITYALLLRRQRMRGK
ncbi:MAG: hypothetical protein ACYCZF_18010 [Anaerolineae bacterium]